MSRISIKCLFVALAAVNVSVYASENDSCTARIIAATNTEFIHNMSNNESVQHAAFCASTYDEYKKSAGGGGGFNYGVIGANGNYSSADYEVKKTKVCGSQSARDAQSELNSRVMSSISYEKLHQICPTQEFTCQYNDQSLVIEIHHNPVNRLIRAYFQEPIITPGSLKLVKGAVKKGQELFPNNINGDGFRIPLQFVKGKEAEAGKVTLNIGLGTSPDSPPGQMETCMAFRPAAIEPRQVFYTPGSSEMSVPTIVRPTFSRIRNDALDLEYEWFSFTTPKAGNIEIRLYAQTQTLQLRIHSGPNLLPVDGNNTIVYPGKHADRPVKALANTTYVVGIQKYTAGLTGAQLDVSYAPN